MQQPFLSHVRSNRKVFGTIKPSSYTSPCSLLTCLTPTTLLTTDAKLQNLQDGGYGTMAVTRQASTSPQSCQPWKKATAGKYLSSSLRKLLPFQWGKSKMAKSIFKNSFRNNGEVSEARCSSKVRIIFSEAKHVKTTFQCRRLIYACSRPRQICFRLAMLCRDCRG